MHLASAQNLAGIDIGTNSVRLLIINERGEELTRWMEITRLGQGVDQNGCLSAEAIDRTLEVLKRYRGELLRHQTQRVRITATSAARDASNREAFFGPLRELMGQEPELLSGETEAQLSFVGATDGVEQDNAPFLVFDIGGGSTEFAFGSAAPSSFVSLDMGGVRMTERFLTSDPPRAEELDRCRAFVREQLDYVSESLPVAEARTWLGLAGTVTTCAAYALNLKVYDATLTHGFELSAEHASRFLRELSQMTTAERRVRLLEKKRAEVIVGGAVILDAIFKHFKLKSVRVSEKDILDGLAASLLT
ncbi:MAG: hypothetical protein RJA70_3744 [Pseudomonadota bacterium]|jgi:exopolyphosphatase/guanosine-5'-triphosphate,3'-diphosphate pyrophosphatase